MASTMQIPLIGGTADGETVTVELDSNGRPPLTHHHLGPEGLAHAQIYELQSDDEHAREWVYTFRGPAA
ncbi:hypothetical protein [Micromonospora chersina]|uniref:hypothetical protein n=1 Tax=Micromonospora chersina TaxID=47854 RepID=UPI001B2E02B8|nr:hypothetical protein Nm8I071_16530 [Nonomuraea sp. TT08I-71]